MSEATFKGKIQQLSLGYLTLVGLERKGSLANCISVQNQPHVRNFCCSNHLLLLTIEVLISQQYQHSIRSDRSPLRPTDSKRAIPAESTFSQHPSIVFLSLSFSLTLPRHSYGGSMDRSTMIVVLSEKKSSEGRGRFPLLRRSALNCAVRVRIWPLSFRFYGWRTGPFNSILPGNGDSVKTNLMRL